MSARRRLGERAIALAASLALHLGALILLLFGPPNSPPAVPPAAQVTTMILVPSSGAPPAQTAEAVPAAAPRPTPRPKPKPKPKVQPAPIPRDVPPATPASAAGAPTGPVMTQFPMAYLVRVSRMITLRLHYPAHSRQFAEQGRAIVRVTLTREGRVLDAVVVRRTGYRYLDEEARNVILRIARFPPVPDDIHPAQREFVIDQPITFERS